MYHIIKLFVITNDSNDVKRFDFFPCMIIDGILIFTNGEKGKQQWETE